MPLNQPRVRRGVNIWVAPMRQRVSKLFSKAQLSYVVALGSSLVLALTFVGQRTAPIALGILLVGGTLIVLLVVATRFGQVGAFWSSVEFVLLISGLFSVLSGLATFTKSQHASAESQLVASIKEAYVNFENIGEAIYFKCSGRLPVPGNDPQNPCERTGHFLRQIKVERDRPSYLETGFAKRWDLNFCGTTIPDGIDAGDWNRLCEAAVVLNNRQEKLRTQIANRPSGLFIRALTGSPLMLSLLITAALFGAKCAKFVYDLRDRDEGSKAA